VIRIGLVLAVLAAAGGCILTRGPSPEDRPRWRIVEPTAFAHGCASARAFVRKSGKTGVGMSIELRSHGDCAIAITRAELVLSDGQRVAAGFQPVPPLVGRSLIHHWLAFPFDNNAAWNRHVVDGVFELELTVAGAAAPPWRLAAKDQ
jgi:hypothetical protein